MKSLSCCKSGITCSNIKHIPYNLIFTTKCNDSSIMLTIISWHYLNLSLPNEYVGNVTIPTRFITYDQCCSMRISQSDCSTHFKLNYIRMKGKYTDVLQTNIDKVWEHSRGEDLFKNMQGN